MKYPSISIIFLILCSLSNSCTQRQPKALVISGQDHRSSDSNTLSTSLQKIETQEATQIDEEPQPKRFVGSALNSFMAMCENRYGEVLNEDNHQCLCYENDRKVHISEVMQDGATAKNAQVLFDDLCASDDIPATPKYDEQNTDPQTPGTTTGPNPDPSHNTTGPNPYWHRDNFKGICEDRYGTYKLIQNIHYCTCSENDKAVPITWVTSQSDSNLVDESLFDQNCR